MQRGRSGLDLARLHEIADLDVAVAGHEQLALGLGPPDEQAIIAGAARGSQQARGCDAQSSRDGALPPSRQATIRSVQFTQTARRQRETQTQRAGQVKQVQASSGPV